MRPVFGFSCLAFCGLLLLTGCARLNPFKRSETASDGLRVGTRAPDFEAEDFNGKRIRLSDYRGKVVALVFWASWCPPCRAMIPHERELVERFHDAAFVMIGVNNDTDHQAAQKVIAAERMTWPICKSGGSLNQLYKVPYLPTIYVIDANGVIRFTQVRGPALESAINTLLAETNQSLKR